MRLPRYLNRSDRDPGSSGPRSLAVVGVLLVATATATAVACGSGEPEASENGRPTGGSGPQSSASRPVVVAGTSPSGVRYEVRIGDPEEILGGGVGIEASENGDAWCAAVRYGRDRTKICGVAEDEGLMQVLPAGLRGAVVVVVSADRSVAEVEARLTGGGGTAAAARVSGHGGLRLAHLAIPTATASRQGSRAPASLQLSARNRAGNVIERQVVGGGPPL